MKEYPKDFLEVKVYTPVLHTKENLSRTVKGVQCNFSLR